MKIIKVSRTGWSFNKFFLPRNLIEVIILRRRGYFKLPSTSLLGRIGYYSHNRYRNVNKNEG